MPNITNMPRDVELRGWRRTATHCYLWEKTDHDHFTGKFIGIAHNKCNLKRQIQSVLKICFHNSSYDFALFVRKFLNSYAFESRVECILKTKDKFLTATKFLKFGEEIIQDKKTGEKRISDFEFKI